MCCKEQQNGSHRQVHMYCVYLPVVRLGTLGSNNAKAKRQQRDSNATATRQQRERRLKCEFAFLPIYFVKCRRTLQKLNSNAPYLSSETEIKFRRCLFLLSTKREVRHFYVVVVQNGEEMYKKV